MTASMPPTSRNSCQQQRPRYQHCRRTLSPLCIASTENRKTTYLRTRSARGRGNAQAHTKIKIRKFLLRGLWPFIRNFAPTKISRYTVAKFCKVQHHAIFRQQKVKDSDLAIVHAHFTCKHMLLVMVVF